MVKEHCKNCVWNVPENGDGIHPFCDWYAKEIEDEEDETCFDWELEEEECDD